MGRIYRAEEHTQKVTEEKLQNNFGEEPEGYELTEAVPGLDKYLKVKAILEAKYGQKITEDQMRKIFDEVLKTSKHEKLVRKKYGEGPNYWRTRNKK